MSKIELRVESLRGVVAERTWACVFGVAGGTIGRAGQNKFILPDDEGDQIARVHAMVRLDSEHAYIANLAERHSVVVNGEPVAAGVERRLSVGMALGIGPYLLRAHAVTGDGALAPTSRSGLTEATNPWADVAPDVPIAVPAWPTEVTPVAMTVTAAPLAFASASDNPFDFLGRIETPVAQPAPAYKALLIPESFDIMAAPTAKSQEPEHKSLAQVANIKSDSLLKFLPATDTSPQAMDNPAHRGLPKAFDTAQVLDPMALFGSAGGVDLLDMGLPMAAQGSDLAQSFILPQQAVASSAPSPSPSPLPSPAPTTAPVVAPTVASTFAPTPIPTKVTVTPDDMQALAQAFLQGAQVEQDNLAMRITPEFMRAFGAAFQVAVQGTIDLLAIRSEIKREFRADVTIISSGANNPLKFLPTAEGVIMQLAGQALPGFMKPQAAMHEAYQDLRVHQLALMAGIRAAYSEALARFDPQEIEKAEEPGFLEKISTSARKAALWDAYTKRYRQTRRMADDDLTAFSGRTFLSAYEAAAEDWKKGQI